ncbi:MAG TPA: histidine phosphatase family protein [bacterium]|nr:histidine phosphatase family protein [bacterium]
MSTLYLVRHGQASFGQADYDRLSELGQRQSRALGEYWAKWRVKIDAAIAGALERQKASASFVRTAYEDAGLPFPELQEMAEWNEYDTAAILTGSIPDLIAKHPDILELAKKLSPDGKPDLRGNKEDFQRMFARIMDLWVKGELNVQGLESWRDFTARVNRGLSSVMARHDSGKTVAVFTSGGPISAAVQRALQSPDKIALDLGWSISNSSITEFRYSGDKFSLAGFNGTPHLNDPSLISYR